MAIERLSFPEYVQSYTGVPLNSRGEAIDGIYRLIDQYREYIRTLREGTYPLNPRIWREPSHIHELIVYANGTGTYRAKAIGDGTLVHATVFSNVLIGEVGPGGKTFAITQDTPITVVMGHAHPFFNESRVYEIIFFTPGRSPRLELPIQR